MTTEEERKEEIKKAFFEYAAHNTLLACDTPGYFARQILPDESFFLKANVIADLIESKVMVIDNRKWIIKNEVTKTCIMAFYLPVFHFPKIFFLSEYIILILLYNLSSYILI